MEEKFFLKRSLGKIGLDAEESKSPLGGERKLLKWDLCPIIIYPGFLPTPDSVCHHDWAKTILFLIVWTS